MGHLLGHGVRFGVAHDVMAAGEGIETMLSLRCAMPVMPMMAALSAAHPAAILFPVPLRRLYIARDDDPAGGNAMEVWSTGRTRPASRRSRCRHRSGISTRICACAVSTRFERGCGCRSLRTTSLVSWHCRRQGRTGIEEKPFLVPSFPTIALPCRHRRGQAR